MVVVSGTIRSRTEAQQAICDEIAQASRDDWLYVRTLVAKLRVAADDTLTDLNNAREVAVLPAIPREAIREEVTFNTKDRDIYRLIPDPDSRGVPNNG